MIFFKPQSPLLKAVLKELTRDDCAPEGAVWVDGFESLLIQWFPIIENGLIILDEEEGWIQEEPPGKNRHDEVLLIQVRSDGRIQIATGEGEHLFETTIIDGHEFNEILDFYENSKISCAKFEARKTYRLHHWIEKVFLLIPKWPDGSGVSPLAELWPLSPSHLKSKHPNVWECANAYLKNQKELIAQIGYWHFGAYLENNNLEGVFEPKVPLQSTDIILQGDDKILSAASLLQLTESEHGSQPAVVLRPADSVSRFWLWDYLIHASEADSLASTIAANWEGLPKNLSSIEIVAPIGKTAQFVDAVKRRNARQVYLDTLSEAMKVREPFESMERLYSSRKSAAEILHGDFLEDIDAIRRPLPFFIEYPFRAFRKESDQLQKIANGQRLLNIFVRIPIFLVIEELLTYRSDLGEDFLGKVKKRPLSDGAFAQLHQEVVDSIAKKNYSLRIFRELVEFMSQGDMLEEIVQARNRMHHEPYDQEGFVSVLSERAPMVISHLRDALNGIKFLIPQGVKISGGKILVEAEDVSSFDGFFSRRMIEISDNIENYETGKIVVVRDDIPATLKMNFLIQANLKLQKIRDFGIFERMKSSGPEYTYLRG